MVSSPPGVLVIATTASECVWSTKSNGINACKMASTEGVGAFGSVMAAFCTRTMSVSLSCSSAASFNKVSIRTGAKPLASMVARSQPLPFTYKRCSDSPNRFDSRTFTEVLPPPWSTSAGSRPSRREV